MLVVQVLRDSPSSFFCPTSRSSQESEGFFLRQATYKGTYVEAVESARAGLLPKKWGHEKEKKTTKEGGLSPQEGDVRKKKRRRPRKVVELCLI